jgi:predicted nucleic acid-binding protein
MNGDAPAFVDANVLVYAFDVSAGPKHAAAIQLLETLWASGTGCLSVQVLQEFFVTITRQVPTPLSTDDAAARVREFSAWDVFTPTADDVLQAMPICQSTGLSFWDALIVQAATELQCETLSTEDLADGQVIRGVRIRNPFRS